MGANFASTAGFSLKHELHFNFTVIISLPNQSTVLEIYFSFPICIIYDGRRILSTSSLKL